MHRKHGIDRGTEVTEGRGAWGGYPSGSGVPPPPEKLQRTSNTIVGLLPPIFGIWFGVFPIGTACRPIQLQSATRRPDCAWTVGIASVGTVCRNSVVYPFNTIHALLCDRRTVGETNGQVDRNCCNACIACYATKL